MPKYEGINRNYEAGVWNKDEGPTAEERKAERDRLMKEFLAKGGKVEKLAPGNAKVYASLSRGGKPNGKRNKKMDLETLKKLAGVPQSNTVKENPSITGTEKAKYQRQHNIKPGTQEWFKLWFSRPKMTGENPMPKSKK
jgi:hypothetical protein